MAVTALERETSATRVIVWRPQVGPQHAFIDCPYFDVLFGGARGGGKSDACLGEFAIHAKEYGKGARGVFMRREMPQADSLIDRSHDIYAPLGWTFHKQDRQWSAPNGAILRFRPLEDDRDAEKYQGQNFTRVYLEELTNWPTPRAPDKMKATLRSAAGVPCLFRATANPGGAGHQWVKQRYIDPAPQGMVPIEDESGRHDRMFIPAKVSDNAILLQADPAYVDRLRLAGSLELVKAWLDGDWSVIEGAYFDCWSSQRHVCKPFELPKHWARFRSFDWGGARPFSVGWYAVASDDTSLGNGMTLPRGGLVKYREWYGAKSANVGLNLDNRLIGQGIAEREAYEEIIYGVADPSIFKQEGGPSIYEQMHAGYKKLVFRPADNTRTGPLGHAVGWGLVRSRLLGEADDRPMIVFFDTCRDTIRTLPALQHDKAKAEDVDTDGEDHAADELRYACASRPWLRKTPQGPLPITGIETVTMDRLWLEQKRSVNRRV
jgi:hypothetical protein